MEKDYSKYFTPSLKEARRRTKKESEIITYSLPSHLVGLGSNKTYIIKTYGCQGNLADTENMSGIMEELEYKLVSHDEDADVIIFNTCAIREGAEDRVFGELGRIKNLKKHNPDLLIIICGCMSQEETTIARIIKTYPQVDIVFGTHNIYKLAEYLHDAYFTKEKVVEVFSKEGSIIEGLPVKRDHQKKAWVNIMYGCDEFCTYCIVPYTRGKERSRLPDDIIKEVRELCDAGYVEVTLLGQNVNSYGKDLKDLNYTFSNLLTDLSKIDIPRIRYTTSHPRDFDDETIEAMRIGKNIMPHLHLPVQSGSNKVLKKMNRKYTKESYLEKISKLKVAVPSISITTDIIVGFPGENEEDFQETLDLVDKAGFEGAFTFIFSAREGTPAARYPDDVSMEEKKIRLQRLNKIINDGFLRGNMRFEGETVNVLVEGVSQKNNELLSGYTEHYKLVNFPGTIDLVGKIIPVEVEKAYTWHLKGISK